MRWRQAKVIARRTTGRGVRPLLDYPGRAWALRCRITPRQWARFYRWWGRRCNGG